MKASKLPLHTKPDSSMSQRCGDFLAERLSPSYTLAQVKKEILEYFRDIAAKNLGVNLHYRNSFVGLISIDSDKDLRVCS